MNLSVERHELGAVSYAVITPPADGPLPLCIVLMGGGGTREHLVACQPLFEKWWAEGVMPPMILATPTAGMSYYLDDPVHWDSFLAEEFPAALKHDGSKTVLMGISMGGYGALKVAFAYPERFQAVAAMQPMLEPGFHDADIGARNRIHHPSGGPAGLIGAGRDPAVFEANNPASRAHQNAPQIRNSGLAIYIDAGDQDFVNAHDGAEFLHRVLWDLDISHEYHLVRGGDHGGPTFVPRMRAAFAWLASVLAPTAKTAHEAAVEEWIRDGMKGNPPAVPPSSKAFLQIMRAQLQPVRDEAAAKDPSTARRFGVLPSLVP
ncbi:MAG TPA: alpha/beta hydrolase-fold protein [Bryobacteraceae bacterium]|nr:alpha/beta hydrolase-fold protein [Bryobacteraceae bacterium]